MRTYLLAALLVCCAPAARAQTEAPGESAEIREYYDKAFGYYVAGEYARAIEHWSMVLRADPKQTTARNMIEEARKKMAGTSADLKGALRRLLEKGRYSDALIKLEELLATDQTNPWYMKLQGRLRRISALVPARPATASVGTSHRGWNAASEGISAWLDEKEDLAFAYDALRYAAELAPSDKVFGRLTAALEEEAPQLKLNDTKPENSGVLEHKKEMALHQIYDSKFYLAVKELEGVLRLEPGDIIALKRAGSAYLQLKDYRQARRAWQKALQLSPEDAQLKEYLDALDALAKEGKKAAE
ncbi:MAG: tetratricopeptide repeat protein [Elusimicrobia bacterium]|nr:tetratricopeptide repeat protein [Elusimicrobiota bacterium]